MRIAIGPTMRVFVKDHLVATWSARARGRRSRHVLRGPDDYPPICAASRGGRRAAPTGESSSAGQRPGRANHREQGPRHRAALCNDLYTARLSREHNDANVLAIGGRIVAPGLADEIITLWLATAFQGGRHQRRVDQIAEIEREESAVAEGKR
jgi:ribose 5-phosphate isomerase B